MNQASDAYAAYMPAAPQAKLPRLALQLSCVVPAYNEQENLEQFIHALMSAVQALTSDFEIIVVNDGSRDGTHDVAMHLVEQG
ncbi:glycosyltransferase, partial [Comamonas sp.]